MNHNDERDYEEEAANKAAMEREYAEELEAEHMQLVHPDGGECPDGCDSAPVYDRQYRRPMPTAEPEYRGRHRVSA